MGLSAQFYANNFDELRALETTFSDKGKSEETILNPLIKMIQPGDVAYDIGSNIGIHSVFMAKKAEKNGRIIAFEPENMAFEMLKNNVRLNKLNNIRVMQIAMGDQIESGALYNRKQVGIGAVSLIRSKDSEFCQNVDIFPGDLIVKQRKLPLPKAVKIDVEGFEYLVLKGLKRTLTEKNCRVLCCEIHPDQLFSGITVEKIIDLIKKYGFVATHLYPRGGEIHAICYKDEQLKG